MRATMNLLSTLAFITIGLFLPALSAPSQSDKSYSVLLLDTKAFGDPPTKQVGAVLQQDGGDNVAFGKFAIKAGGLNEFLKTTLTEDTPVDHTSIDKFPKNILLNHVIDFPVLYSEALPHLLKEIPLEKLAEELPKNLLKDLKPEDKKKISPEVLAKFEKLYH